MKWIQLLLIFSVIALMVLYFNRLRSRLLDRLAVLSLGTFGLTMILMPEWAQRLANLFGVGRGVDFIIYLSLLGLIFLWLLLFSKVRELEQLLTNIVRSQSLDEARKNVKQ